MTPRVKQYIAAALPGQARIRPELRTKYIHAVALAKVDRAEDGKIKPMVGLASVCGKRPSGKGSKWIPVNGQPATCPRCLRRMSADRVVLNLAHEENADGKGD